MLIGLTGERATILFLGSNHARQKPTSHELHGHEAISMNTGLASIRHLWRIEARQSVTGSRRLPKTVSRNPLPSGRGDSMLTYLFHAL